jgi:hypothetical protein
VEILRLCSDPKRASEAEYRAIVFGLVRRKRDGFKVARRAESGLHMEASTRTEMRENGWITRKYCDLPRRMNWIGEAHSKAMTEQQIE